jgi:hypothetical protein
LAAASSTRYTRNRHPIAASVPGRRIAHLLLRQSQAALSRSPSRHDADLLSPSSWSWDPAAADVPGTVLADHRAKSPRAREGLEVADSPLEGNGFELPRARDRPSGFEASAELGRSTVGAAVAFSRIALGFSTETDSPLEERGFELLVPP